MHTCVSATSFASSMVLNTPTPPHTRGGTGANLQKRLQSREQQTQCGSHDAIKMHVTYAFVCLCVYVCHFI